MANGQAPLALRNDAPTAFGSREEIKAIADRISVMLPSARLSENQVSKDKDIVAALQKRLDDTIYRAAQLCVFYRLVPGEDVHVIPFGDAWAVDMGIETYKKAADRYCSLHQITYHIHVEDMPEAMLRERRGKDYDPEDVGVVAYLWRSDKTAVYEIFGPKESMSRAYGIWAKKAKEVYGKWKADNIPAQRSKQDVAKRRAMKAVLRLEFSLDSLLAATPAELRDNITVIGNSLRAEEQRRALPAPRQYEVDEDGVFVVETPRAVRPIVQDVEFVVAEEPEPDIDELDDGPDFDEVDEAPELLEGGIIAATDPAAPDYRALAAQFTSTEKNLIDWAKKHRDHSSGPASPEQYQFLAGELDTLVKTKGGHNLLLGILVGRKVSKEQVPNGRLCTLLLDFILKDLTVKDEDGKPAKDAKGKVVKTPNKSYREDVVDSLTNIWHTVREPSGRGPQASNA